MLEGGCEVQQAFSPSFFHCKSSRVTQIKLLRLWEDEQIGARRCGGRLDWTTQASTEQGTIALFWLAGSRGIVQNRDAAMVLVSHPISNV